MNEQMIRAMKNDAQKTGEFLRSRFEESIPSLLFGLCEAQDYSLFAGGKRIRPVLTLAFCRLFGGSTDAAVPYAAAIEMIHTASLIHDDLPSIDNDDLRRGRPTSHKAFGEATAILAADAMLMDSFGLVAENPRVSPEFNARAVAYLSRATGTLGLVGGEYIDVMNEGKLASLDELRTMHRMKTGALIRASVALGAIAAGVSTDDERMKDAVEYAECVGLAFQIVDDVLDRTGNSKELGKNTGSDQRDGKSTYLSFFGVEEALLLAGELTERAVLAISKYEGSDFLVSLAKYLQERRN